MPLFAVMFAIMQHIVLKLLFFVFVHWQLFMEIDRIVLFDDALAEFIFCQFRYFFPWTI